MSAPKFVAWDTETSGHNKGDNAVGDFTADPHSPENWVVWDGFGVIDPNTGEVDHVDKVKIPTKEEFAIPPPAPGIVVVGHNLKFDLSFMANPNNKYADEWISWIRDPASRIWDTQVAEYRLRGQWLAMPSLDTCSMIRGWPLKPGRLKEYWEKGISTEEVPDDEVEPYLDHDVVTVGRLFVDQVAQADRMVLMPLLLIEMQATLTLTDGEINGMAFLKKQAMDAYEGSMAEAIAGAETLVRNKLTEIGIPEAAQVPGSNPMLTAMIYGGSYKYKENRPMLQEDGEPLLFKSGKKKGMPRFKWANLVWQNTPKTRAKTKSVDEEALTKIKEDKTTDPLVAEAIDLVLKWRTLRKEATDFTGYAKLTWDHDGKIHGNLNQTVARTGRLSSSKPNLQNAKKGPVRVFFVSRHEGGVIIEVDLSQIEVVVQAILSGDANMLKDLHDGVDFHSKRTAIAAGVEYELVRKAYLNADPKWTSKRDDAKVFSFQRAYGAGPAKIALTTGMTMAAVKKLIDGEEEEYPGVKEMTDRWEDEVFKSAKRIDDDVLGQLTSPTNARYVFKREHYNGKMSFKPTTIKNYPIQGLAGDIIKVILARIRPSLYAWSNLFEVFFINTVHDSILFDAHLGPEDIVKFSKEIVEVMTTETEQVMQDYFGLDFQGLIKADVDVGTNWGKYKSEENPTGMRPLKI